MAGQSEPHISLFSAEEVEFMAEDELIEIVPNMRMAPLNFICGDFGPFLPQIPTQVPLWLAVALKKRGRCAIRPPQWMSVENLTRVLEGERESQGSFQFNSMKALILCFFVDGSARDDIPDMYMVRSLIEDIRDVRIHKVETSLEKFSGTSAVKIPNLSAMEVNIIRPFVGRALQAFYKHDNPEKIPDVDRASSQQTRVANNEPRRPLRR
ncbi:DNA replication complex GINS protein PSF2 [Hibiscus syriacus]|uniref:DNA replication complex GINS protein PSF2 n=1 Tax=Hibiscus syriacus TaxID=106335 RepID=A0A6A3B6R0_HIBSY|nr:DNA replication complex GINS protein PSF2 [Hibiscus syriacus]